jgi:antitoxin component of RelBE/YafQ-DinJ toxin-antitoxin module
MMPAKDSGLRIRVEKDLRQAFVQACRRQGLVASSVLRDFMQRYADRNWNGFQGNLFQVSDANATKRREASR